MEGDAFDPMQSGSKVRGLGWLGRGRLLFVEARTPVVLRRRGRLLSLEKEAAALGSARWWEVAGARASVCNTHW